MKGIMEFTGSNKKMQLVGKVKEYPSKAEFASACVIDYGNILPSKINESDISEGIVRYYPHGTEETSYEFGNDGVYLFVDKLTQGAFKVWVIETK